MLDYTENMIRDIKAALFSAMRRRKEYLIEWEDSRGTEREFTAFAMDENDAIGLLYYKLASSPRRRSLIGEVHITSVELLSYVTNGGQKVFNDGSPEFAEKYDSRFGPIPFAPEKLKSPIGDFIDHQIWERKECGEND